MKVKFTIELDLSSPTYKKYELEKLVTDCTEARKKLGLKTSINSIIESAMMLGCIPHIVSNLKFELYYLNKEISEKREGDF